MTEAIYYEAAREPVEGQEAVAQVVLNRLAHRAFPKSVCGVVYQGSQRRTGCQFTFTCDGSLARVPDPALWASAGEVARRALDGRISSRIGGALNYHADYVAPVWAGSLTRVAQIGAHIFYGRGGAASGGSAVAVTTRTPAPVPAGFSAWGIAIATLGRDGRVTSALPPEARASRPAPVTEAAATRPPGG